MRNVRLWVRRWRSVAGAAVALTAAARPTRAQQDSTADSAASLEARVEQLDQEVRVLQRLQEIARDSVAVIKDKAGATASAKDGFSLKSADGKFGLKLRGLIQADARFFPGDDANAAVNTFFIRRARPILDVTIGKLLEARLQPDFGQGQALLYDAYADVKLDPKLVIRAGKFKPPLGLERLQSAGDIVFAERALATNLVPNRDVGLQLSGETARSTVAWQAGVFNGTPDLGNLDGDVSDAKDFAARVFVRPFRFGALKGLGVGVAGSTGIERGTITAPALAGYRTPGQATFFRYRGDATAPNTVVADGTRSRLVPQAYFYSGPLGILGEYAFSWQEVRRVDDRITLEHQAWQVTGSYFLTGEQASYRSATPKHVFDPSAGEWGALELAARYSQISVDDASFPLYANPASAASKARAWGVGLNWYFARAMKLVLDYERTTFDGGAATGDRPAENFVVSRIQYGS